MRGNNSLNRKTRILYIEHAAAFSEERKKYAALAKLDQLEVTVVLPANWLDLSREEHSGDVNSYSFAVKERRVLFPGFRHRSFFLGKVAKIFQDFQPDVIHIFDEANTMFALQAVLMRNLYCESAHIIFDNFQNITYKRPPYKMAFFYNHIESYVFKHSSCATTRYHESIAFLVNRGYQNKIYRLPWCTDGNLFKKKNADSIRARYNLRSFTIGYFGRLEPEKGVLHLLHAFSMLAANAELLLVGKGCLEKRIIEKCRNLGIEQRVHLIGYIPQSDLSSYYSAVDCVVVPSLTTPIWKEQFGRVLVEAMSCSVPVVGSDSGAIPDVVGSAGLIYPENDNSSLVAALTKLITDKGLHKKLSDLGRKRVLELYTLERFAESCLLIYQKTLMSNANRN